MIFSHGTSNSKGVAILCPNNTEFELLSTSDSLEGRKVTARIKCNEEYYSLCNVYAPTRDKLDDHKLFISSLRTDIDEGQGHVIIGGDLNLYIDATLDKDQVDGVTDTPATK